MQRIIILICLFLSAGIANSQQINLDKAQKAIDEGYFERAYKLTSDALENEVTKKDPLTYYLHAISLFELSKIFLLKKIRRLLKMPVKWWVKQN